MLNVLNLEGASIDLILYVECLSLGSKLHPAPSVSVELNVNNLAIVGGKSRFDSPVFLGNEGTDLLLTLGNDSGRNRLNTSTRKTTLKILPKHLGKLEAYETVKNSSCLLGVNKIHVYLTGILDSLLNSTLCDLIEGNTAGSVLGNTELTCDVPGNSLSLTVRVGCEEYLVSALRFLLKFLNNVALTTDIYIVRLEVVFNVNSERTLGQITNVTLRCNNLIVRTKVAFYCIGLCRRLNDY